MRKLLVSSITAVACGGLLVGCASSMPMGIAYTKLKLPVTATDHSMGSKVGTACSESYFGLVAIGDSSIDTAKKNGGITKVSHVDWDAENILGIYGNYKVTVYGE